MASKWGEAMKAMGKALPAEELLKEAEQLNQRANQLGMPPLEIKKPDNVAEARIVLRAHLLHQAQGQQPDREDRAREVKLR